MTKEDTSTQILSDITVHMKYARYIPELNRRETWGEIVERNKNMHINRFPQLKEEIESVYRLVEEKKVLPSMRSMQFAGKPIEVSPNRIYNCAYLPVDDVHAFSESMFLLLGGTGVGYSVQRHHVENLPPLRGPIKPQDRRYRPKRFLIGDSIEGWADAIKALMNSYFQGTREIEFDYRDIRPKGAKLVTSGGKAPGPQPLKDCIHNIKKVLNQALEERGSNTQITPLEVHDIMCYIADAVLAGGIRRAAMISLFSFDDEEMRTCKFGNWWEMNPQRGRANNSAVAVRHKIQEEDFFDLWEKIKASGSGEPGIYFTNDKDWGTNPCVEIGLRPFQFCNLTTINASTVVDQEDLNERAKAAAFIGTLQATYTDFHYLRDIWRETTEKDALLGVSMTGIASGTVLDLDLKEAAAWVKKENARAAKKLGINKAARTTAVKPEGTSSLSLGTSSGIHAWHNDYYLRRIRVGKNESIYQYLSIMHPELVEDEYFRPETQAVITVPQKAPKDAILRHETALELLDRVEKVSKEWVHPGHRKGNNRHNVSVTVSIKDHEWDQVGRWMWDNRDIYNGISVLPFDGGTYVQAPFEDITEEEYNKRIKNLVDVDLTKVTEEDDDTNLSGEIACGGGSCEVTTI